jgi:phosphatidylinositol alpha-1,6-mannosyltransferase
VLAASKSALCTFTLGGFGDKALPRPRSPGQDLRLRSLRRAISHCTRLTWQAEVVGTPHVLVTNDFPPKVGGIQSYLWELWRRLPPSDVTVFTASHLEARWWDSQQDFRIVRAREPVLLPQPHLARRVRELARQVGAKAVVIDPALPLGLVGPVLGLPYAVVLHGAEVTVPARLPASRQLMARVLRNASLVISAGGHSPLPAPICHRASGRPGPFWAPS